MTFKQLALAMASEVPPHYKAHLEHVATDRAWVDASFLHALACRFKVDVAIWQPDSDPLLLGCSLHGEDSLAFIAVGLVNDFHFWGATFLREPEHRVSSSQDREDLRVIVSEKLRSKKSRTVQSDDDEDATALVPYVSTTSLVDFNPKCMGQNTVFIDVHVLRLLFRIFESVLVERQNIFGGAMVSHVFR